MAKLNDLTDTYATMRMVAIICIVALVITVLAACGLVLHAYGSVGQRVYVVGQSGTTKMALAASPEDHTEFEMRNLVRSFAGNMFGHDQYTYKTNLNAALPLIDDAGGRLIYQTFKQQDILGTYVKFGARTTVTVDSIKLDTSTLPVRGRLYMRQTGFLGDRQSKSQAVGCAFELTNTYRSDRNPFGMMLTRFSFMPYNPAMSSSEERKLLLQQERDAAELQAAKDAAAPAPAQ